MLSIDNRRHKKYQPVFGEEGLRLRELQRDARGKEGDRLLSPGRRAGGGVLLVLQPARGACATVGSLALEETHLPRFRVLGVDCLDMECSAVFSASKQAGKSALALLYVSNSLPDKPWHEQLDQGDIQRLGRSRKDLAALLLGFFAGDPRSA